MAYELVQSGSTQFAIDWDIVRRIVKSYHTAYLQYQYSREVAMSDSAWYNPFSWSLPDLTHVEVDWDSVQTGTQIETDFDVQEMREKAKTNAAEVARRLEAMIDATRTNKEYFVDKMGAAQTKNMQAINKAVDDYDSHIEVARFVRDRSADGLMVGASVMTGGAAVAVMGAGSVLKGQGKFQDTGSVGAGVMEGVGSFAFAYVKLGKTFSFKQDMMLALVQAPYKAGTELVGGATLSKAALSGGLKLTGPAVDMLFKIGPAKTLFDKVAIPLMINYGGKNVASSVLSKFTGKAVQGGIELGAKKSLLGSSNGNGATNGNSAQGQLIAEATLSDKYLLYLGFVNMSKGIGHGW